MRTIGKLAGRLDSIGSRAGGSGFFAAAASAVMLVAAGPVVAADATVRSDKGYVISFAAEDAKFVRFVVFATNGNAACVDELEVYGPDGKQNLALAKNGGRPSASSSLSGYAIHKIDHLNDGEYGNDRSWVAGGGGEQWAQIELPGVRKISRVVFSRDRRREFADRVPIHFAVQLSTDGKTFKTVKQVKTTAVPVAVRRGHRGSGPRIPSPPPPPRLGKSVPAAFGAGVPREDALGFANLALHPKARPAASSCLPGHAIHKIAHLNDGRYGNDHSWISQAAPSWAEIDLGDVYWVYKVAFGSDHSKRFKDRAATRFSIVSATEYNEETGSATWQVVYRQEDGPAVGGRREFAFKPVQCRWVRIAIEATNSSPVRIDEIEVFGQAERIPLDKIGPADKPAVVASESDEAEQLRYALLGEEHAWLKTYGRADLSPRLVPYNGRVKKYPHHVGDDRVPLPPLSSAPTIDGRFDDRCWQEGSCGAAWVAFPYEFETGALITYEVTAGRHGDDLYLYLRTNKLLSRHVAVVSSGDWGGCGVVVLGNKELVFNAYEDGRMVKSTPVESAFDEGLTCFEMRLPLKLFPDCQDEGLRIGLGMGGRHTDRLGRSVHFVFSSLSLAEAGPCLGGTFRVRVGVAGPKAVQVRGNAPGLEEGVTLANGESKTIAIPTKEGAIGPEYELTIHEGDREAYTLHLFRYDPMDRVLFLEGELVDRLAAKGLDVRAERAELARFRERHAKLLAADKPDIAAERKALLEARAAKRRLFFRDPDLEPIEKVLFVKRHPFEPSHNYSVLLDSRYRGEGGVCVIEIPRREGRFSPGQARVTRLFDAGSGIARNPMADFDVSKIYFGYRPSKDGYYHVMRMNSDGSGVTQLTDGPFHDYWPCPLPDGSLAFISTRCKARYLCWRPQVALLFRMDADGGNIEPLSHSNLSEWAPSVMADGRIIWTRSEYLDKGADFGHTLWAIRPDGYKPELVFGNTIIQPNGYANGREVPGTNEVCATLISHFGDLNGPIALLDVDQGRFNPQAITSITPEVPWPGMWPQVECFRDPVPVARDYFLCSHAPRDRFDLYVIDRFGNREFLHADADISSMCPTILRKRPVPPVLANTPRPETDRAEVILVDVYEGIAPTVARGRVKYIRVVEEVRSDLERLANGTYRRDHPDFTKWYAAPIDKVFGPYGWPSYVAKAPWGIVPVEADGSAHFTVPAGKTLYFQALDKDLNELQRMRSVVQFQPGEKRSCIGCHESRQSAPPARRGPTPMAMARGPRQPEVASWGGRPFSFETMVQPVLDAQCVRCHDEKDKMKIDLRGVLDTDRIPASYRTLIAQGWVHHADYGYNSGGCEKVAPLSLGTVKSKLWKVLDAGHYEVALTQDEMRRIKTWIDLNCPLWPDYIFRPNRPALAKHVAKAN